MKTILAFLVIGVVFCEAFLVLPHPADSKVKSRVKRLTACATNGHASCKVFCQVTYGKLDGTCRVNQANGKNECHCSEVDSSRRCMIDGSGGLCKASCKVKGYETGSCDGNNKCNCSTEKNGWGDFIGSVGDTFGKK